MPRPIRPGSTRLPNTTASGDVGGTTAAGPPPDTSGPANAGGASAPLRATPGDVINALGDPGANVGAARIEMVARHNIRVPSASGLAFWRPGEFVVVDDDKGIYLAGLDGSRDRLSKSKNDMVDLEGLCLAPDGEHALVVNERTGAVFRLSVEEDGNALTLQDPKRLGTLPEISRKSNKGWEGIDLIPADLSPDGQARMVAVHEGSPRRIGIFSYPDLEPEAQLKLPSKIKKHLDDISDVAVCPRTGHLFLLSDASEKLVEVALTRKQSAAPGALLESLDLELLAVTELADLKRGEKPEGLCFDPNGDLWLATDGDSYLRQFSVVRED